MNRKRPLLLYSTLSMAILFTLAVSYVSLNEVFGEEVIRTIEVRDGPVGVAYNEENADIYVTNSESDTVSVIDGNAIP